MPNRLAHETSPYLLQHQHNPVDWYPWGPEALMRAKEEDKPILVSIGYSACHWCHVMEHESFENEAIARQMNEGFVCIKVDREERPDLDHIYMSAVQVLTRQGGWPLNVFLTPDLKPFYGGTYWPPADRYGRPGFPRVLQAVLDAWQNRRAQTIAQAEELTDHLGRFDQAGGANSGPLKLDLLHDAGRELEQTFDFTWGGFGGAPKFPHAMDLQVLLRLWRRERRSGLLDMVRITLDRMHRGGIYDHLGGGFARYSVDERWLVPHFEKMLYDNALLATTYVEFHLITGEASYAHIARETCDYVLRDMTDPAGGFHSAEDADSEGEEGKFYVWAPDEIRALLGQEKAERFCYVYDVTKQGNFEGHTILNLPKTVAQCAALRGWDLQELEAELAASRAILLAARDKRIRPGKDTKILAAWNGLMIDALARAGAALNEPRYREAATRAAEFVWTHLRRADGRLLRSWRLGKAKYDAYLDDYAGLANGFVSLYEATFDERWIDAAVELADRVLQHFADPAGGFFYTADDHEALIVRHKDLQDGSVPSGNSLAATVLLRLAKLTGRDDYLSAAEGTLKAGLTLMERAPLAAGQMLLALDFYLGPTQELALVGEVSDEFTAVQNEILTRYYPNRVVAWRNPESSAKKSAHLDPLFAGKAPSKQPTLYVCEHFACQAPVSGQAAILAKLGELTAP